MDRDQLSAVAIALGAAGDGFRKGVLAADESTGTIGKRFEAIGVESSLETRRDYREILLRSEAIGAQISGVILYDETLRQSAADGTSFVEIIEAAGAFPGIKVDRGLAPLPGFPGESITQGLDGLAGRLAEYRKLGARFAKWRAVIDVGPGVPSDHAIAANAQALARFAAHCHSADLVPIVEPEVLMDGDHTIERCEEVTEWTLNAVYEALYLNRVVLEHTVLKPSMVISGKKCAKQAPVDEVAARTVRVLKRTVPAAVAGIVFLSGGQSDELATAHLNSMNV